MCVLFLSVIYSHYYAWWAYFNYFNDDYYEQIWHQLLFTVTEMVSTVCVVHMVDAANPVKPRTIVLIIRYVLQANRCITVICIIYLQHCYFPHPGLFLGPVCCQRAARRWADAPSVEGPGLHGR